MQDHDFRQLIERVKLRLPIEGVVGDRVADLRKRGTLFWARCPFHEERTPSFAVDPRRGTWHCYGACGEGGDVLSFVQRFDGLEFLDALRLLAQAAGEDLPDDFGRRRTSPVEKRREELAYDALERAAKLYRRGLSEPGGKAALAYVRGRGFDEETLAAFGIGYASEEGDALYRAASAAGVSTDVLVATGLVRRNEAGRCYDFFRGRLMIPIRDTLGRVVGFGGRAMDAEAKAKYVNTSETELFHKGRLVYGLDRAARAVRRQRHAILVEGYTDVMAAHQVGLTHVVAVLGTATTADHAGLLRRAGARRITLVFDGDAAGRRASRRALPALLAQDLQVDVVSPPAGEDPCDFLLTDPAGGRDAFEALVARAEDWFAWTCAGLVGLSGAALTEGVEGVFEILADLDRPVEEDQRLRELAATLSLSEERVREAWTRYRRRRRPRREAAAGRGASPRRTDGEPDRGRPDACARAFANLLGALLCDNSLIPVYRHLVDEAPEDLLPIFRAVLELYDHGDEDLEIDAALVMGALGASPERDRVSALEELGRTAESPLLLARAEADWLERRRRERELAELKARLQEQRIDAQSDSSEDVLARLHREMRRDRVPVRSSVDTP